MPNNRHWHTFYRLGVQHQTANPFAESPPDETRQIVREQVIALDLPEDICDLQALHYAFRLGMMDSQSTSSGDLPCPKPS